MRLLKLPAAAAFLSGYWGFPVPAGTLRQWAREGKVPIAGKTPGGHYLFALEQLRDLHHAGGRRPTGDENDNDW
jgi:hypothetical protein